MTVGEWVRDGVALFDPLLLAHIGQGVAYSVTPQINVINVATRSIVEWQWFLS